jgi:hypothetical protein
MNICRDCKHLVRDGEGDAWYTFLCKEYPNPTAIDPVTGEKRAFTKNDLGRMIFTNQLYPSCRDINLDGACRGFSPK